MYVLRQSTAGQEVMLGPFVDDTDGKTPETALTIANTDIKIFKAGATTDANKNSSGATHVANGRYYAVFDATDTDTVGTGEINVFVSGALAVRREFQVLSVKMYDALFGASGMVVAGANADATSFTSGLTISNASGSALTLSSSGSNGHGLIASGNGSGHGFSLTGGATGNGLRATGGGTLGHGAVFTGGNAGHGASFTGTGSNSGMNIAAGTIAGGMVITGGTSSGGGVVITTTSGHGFSSTGGGSSSHGINAVGGNGSSLNPAGHGINSTGGIATTISGGVAGNGMKLTGGAGAATTNGAGAGMVSTGGGTTTVSGGNGILTVGTGSELDLYADNLAGGGGGVALTAADVWAYGTRSLTTLTGLTLPTVTNVTNPVTITGDAATAGTRLLTMIELDGAVYRYTTNALEQAPSGGGGVADWTADEKTAIRSILGIPVSGTTPADPTVGILDTIRDAVGAVQSDTDNIQTRLPAALVSGRMPSLVEVVATDAIDAASIKADAVTKIQAGLALTTDVTGLDIPTAAENADGLLNRNIAGGSDGGRTVRQTLRSGRNRVEMDQPAAGQYTVYQEDDTTPDFTGTYTRGSNTLGPLTGTNPV